MKNRLTRVAPALALAAAGLAACLLPSPATAAGAQKAKKHILVVTLVKGYPHGSRASAEVVIPALGEKSGEWDTDFVRTDEDMAAKMTPEALKKYDAVVFANTTGVLPLPDPQGFLDYIKEGHGFATMHSGSDTFHEWPGSHEPVTPYIEMLGGEFQEHHNRSAVDAHIEDPNNPATLPLVKWAKAHPGATATEDELKTGHSVVVGKTWKVFDEIYIQKNNDRTKVHVLLSMDKWPNDGSPHANEPGDHLLSWVKSYGKGRVFYTELGHTPDNIKDPGMWSDELYQQHLQGGIEFVLGLKKGSTLPSAALPTASR